MTISTPIGLDLWSGGQRRFVAPGRPVVVGRDPAADLRIDDEMVSRRHLVVRASESGWWVEDESSNGCFVDGRRVGAFAVTALTRVSLGAPTGALVLVIGC